MSVPKGRKMPAALCLALAALIGLGLGACRASLPLAPERASDQRAVPEAEALLESDPEGPIGEPRLPQGLEEEAGRYRRQTIFPETEISYQVEILSPDLPQAAEIFQKTADLFTLRDKPVTSPLTLARRLGSSLQTGGEILKSLGYYEGRAQGSIEYLEGDKGERGESGQGDGAGSQEAPEPDRAEGQDRPARKGGPEPIRAKAVISFSPGPLYRLGPSKVVIEEEPDFRMGQSVRPALDLEKAGLIPGEPALAENILAAVGRLPALWNSQGFPLAATTGTRYILDKEKKLLETYVSLRPGPYATMGRMRLEGPSPVSEEYLEYHVAWRRGEPWNQEAVERFRDSLYQTGLFKAVRAEMAPRENPGREGLGERDVAVSLEAAPMRTVSGSVNYDSSFGPGLEISWEHRNLTGRGDRLLFELPIWKDLQQLGLSYLRPNFYAKGQNLIADMAVLREKTDSYALASASAAAGLERRFGRRLKGSFQLSYEVGNLDEEEGERRDYLLLGLPSVLEWNATDSLLDPAEGTKASLLASPYHGRYFSGFNILKSRLEASHYFPILPSGRLILALRASAGAIWGEKASLLPASLRFYGGGGGSMRGYEYQSVGPKNQRDKPAGGAASNEVSGELRWRATETLGFTAFVDGGMVYPKADFSSFGKDFLWGGGLGVRYYTSIGPFRLDLATPLTPRREDSPLQVYLSLGQSF